MPIGKFSKSKSKASGNEDAGQEQEAPARGRVDSRGGGKASRGGGRRRSKYSGIKASEPKDNMPTCGDYRFRVSNVVEGYNEEEDRESFKITLEVVDSDGSDANKPGDSVFVVFITSGKGGRFGLERVKSFVMAAAGYDDDDEDAYDEFDPEGDFIDSCTGTANDFSDMGGVTGRLVECRVTRGNATPDGDYYREYKWAPVDDDEQAS